MIMNLLNILDRQCDEEFRQHFISRFFIMAIVIVVFKLGRVNLIKTMGKYSMC